MDPELKRIVADIILYSRTGKTEKLAAELAKVGNDIRFLEEEDPPLAHALQRGHMDAALLLIHAGADVKGDISGASYSKLICAAAGGSLEIVKIMLAAGADPKKRDSSGRSAINYARSSGNAELVAYLETFVPGARQATDPAWLETTYPQLAPVVSDLIARALASGESGETQDLSGTIFPMPEWYLRLCATVPLPGIYFTTPPSDVRSYVDEGHFHLREGLERVREDQEYLIEHLLEARLSPIADGSDGDQWALETDGTPDSPVWIWGQSSMSKEPAFASFADFLRAVKMG